MKSFLVVAGLSMAAVTTLGVWWISSRAPDRPKLDPGPVGFPGGSAMYPDLGPLI